MTRAYYPTCGAPYAASLWPDGSRMTRTPHLSLGPKSRKAAESILAEHIARHPDCPHAHAIRPA